MPVNAHTLDPHPQQCLADTLDDRLALAVQAVQVAAEQHLARQVIGPALIGRGETLALEHSDLFGGQALGRCALATRQRQHGEQHGQ
ncbi:hypothetical protein D3C79_759590 [compost metagenome]